MAFTKNPSDKVGNPIFMAQNRQNNVCLVSRALLLAGLDVGCVSTLTSCSTPMLSELDLSLVTSLNDSIMYKILTPVKDTRPGNFFIEFPTQHWTSDVNKVLI
jgi:hypothetical protein